jgi:hypothetical protein
MKREIRIGCWSASLSARSTAYKLDSFVYIKPFNIGSFERFNEQPVWSKYRSEAPISSIENCICVDHCPGSSSENRPITQAKVYGNWLVSLPAVIVINDASALA